MKKIVLLSLLACTSAFSQITLDSARVAQRRYKMGSYDYHEKFIGYVGYGAPLILTEDCGAAFFGGNGDEKGSFGQLVKVDKNGKEMWQQAVRPQFNEIETQSVVEDTKGNLYVTMLSYDEKRYRGGCERIVCFDPKGTVIFDKTFGNYTLMNCPVFDYIRALPDGRIHLKGHIVIDKPVKGKDPVYRYWEGWIDSQGTLTQKTGDVIVWENKEWMKVFAPE